MGILPYNYSNFDSNSIYDPSYELKRQLQTRQAQLDKLNSHEVLSDEQLKKKQDLEKTVSMLQGKLDKRTSKTAPEKTVIAEKNLTPPKTAASDNSRTFSEGTVIAKNSYPKTPYTAKPNPSNNTYLKGFFFDARI